MSREQVACGGVLRDCTVPSAADVTHQHSAIVAQAGHCVSWRVCVLAHACIAHACVLARVRVLESGGGVCVQITYDWIKKQVEAEGGDVSKYATSQVVSTSAPKALGELRAADGKE